MIERRTTKPSPKKHIAGKDAAAEVPRTLSEADITKDLAMTEVDKNNSTAGASYNNNQEKTSYINFRRTRFSMKLRQLILLTPRWVIFVMAMRARFCR